MKLRLSVYVDRDLMAQLNERAKQQGTSKSQLANAALESFLTPDDCREEVTTHRLDQLTRQVGQLTRDLHICVEALAFFIRTWLSVTPLLPANPQTDARRGWRAMKPSYTRSADGSQAATASLTSLRSTRPTKSLDDARS